MRDLQTARKRATQSWGLYACSDVRNPCCFVPAVQSPTERTPRALAGATGPLACCGVSLEASSRGPPVQAQLPLFLAVLPPPSPPPAPAQDQHQHQHQLQHQPMPKTRPPRARRALLPQGCTRKVAGSTQTRGSFQLQAGCVCPTIGN